MKFGAQYEYVTADNFNQGNMNGTFSFGTSNGPFNANDPRTYPDRFTVRVPGQSAFLEKAHYLSLFVQDKWKMSNRLTATIGVRYDLEMIPVAEIDNPLFASEDDYPVDREQLSSRASGCPTRSTMQGVRSSAAATAGSSTRRTSSSSAVSSTAACSRTRSPRTSRPRLPILDRGTETSRPIRSS